MKRTLAFVLGGGGFAAGLLSANFWALPLLYGIGTLIIVAASAVLLWRSVLLRKVAVYVMFLIIGQLYFNFWEQAVLLDIPYAQSVSATVSVVRCQESFRQFRCIGDINHPFDARVSFEIDQELTPGSVATVTAFVQPLSKQQTYLRGDGVIAFLNQTTVIKVYAPPSVRTFLYRTKRTSEATLSQALTEPSASLATGLLFGSRQQFSDDFVDALKRTNTLHIVAVSGFNITILVEFIRRLLSSLPRKAVFFLTSIGIILFVAMIGAPASAVRAAIMGILLIFGTLLGRKPYVPSMIIVTALLMALPNPYILRYDLGFQLSFLAFVGLVGIAPVIERKLQKIPTSIRGLLAATLGASLATAPLLIPLNNTVSLIGPLTNLLILPLVPLIMLLGSLVLGVSVISISIGRLLGLLLYLPSLWVTEVVEKTAALPLASVHWMAGAGTLVVVAVLINLFRRCHAIAR